MLERDDKFVFCIKTFRPRGKQWVLFPRAPQCCGRGKKNSLFHVGPVNKCLIIYLPSQKWKKKKKLRKNHLPDACWQNKFAAAATGVGEFWLTTRDTSGVFELGGITVLNNVHAMYFFDTSWHHISVATVTELVILSKYNYYFLNYYYCYKPKLNTEQVQGGLQQQEAIQQKEQIKEEMKWREKSRY